MQNWISTKSILSKQTKWTIKDQHWGEEKLVWLFSMLNPEQIMVLIISRFIILVFDIVKYQEIFLKNIFQVSMWMRGKTQRRWWGSSTASAPPDLQGYILLILFETCWVVVMRGSWTCWSSTWGSTAGPRTDTTSAPSVRASWREHLSRELTTRTFSVILWLMIHKVKFLHSKFCPSILYQFLVLNRTNRWHGSM